MIPLYIKEKAREYGLDMPERLYEAHVLSAKEFGHRIRGNFFHMQCPQASPLVEAVGTNVVGDAISYQYRCSHCTDILTFMGTAYRPLYLFIKDRDRSTDYCEHVRVLL